MGKNFRLNYNISNYGIRYLFSNSWPEKQVFKENIYSDIGIILFSEELFNKRDQ
jgi:hypothetical protein